jgi:hypothetical protein
MKRTIVLLALFFAAAIIITGCAKVVICPSSYLVAPTLTTPANWSLVDTLTPTLGWTFPTIDYPYPSAGTTCRPELYRVYLSTGPFFVDELGFDVEGKKTSATVPSDLEPGTEYAWGVQPFSFDESGPYAGNRYFFTGPVCSADALVAPVLLSPFNGGTVNELNPSLIWDYPDDTCRPEGYRIELDTSPEFTNPDLNGGTGNPSTRWGPGDSLTECTTYYWRVTPMVESTVMGPTSETFSFSVNVGGGACTPSTFITGKIWEEYCAIPDGPLPSPLPFGCVATAGGGATGNGILDPGEPGIRDVIVRLGAGSCPSSDLGVVLTDTNGRFEFEGVSPGTYCVSVEVMENASSLIPGGFTFPADAVESTIAYQEVTVGEDDLVQGVNFGWLFQFGPSVPVAEVTGKVFHDVCRNTGDPYSPGLQPEGCVVGADGTAHGNGILDPGEVGIADVFVGISRNGCDGEPFAWSHTDDNGEFYFYVPAGSAEAPKGYCLVIRSNSEINAPRLGEGLWTWPWMYGEPVAKKNIWVIEGAANNQVFGWDYLNLPLQFDLGPFYEYPKFHIDKNSNCRVGPDSRWSNVAVLMAGMEFQVEGINFARNWLLVSPSAMLNQGDFPANNFGNITRQCWVILENGTPSGDLSQVPVREAEAVPTDTPTPVPVDPCSGKTEKECWGECTWHPYYVKPGGYCSSD